MGHSALVRIFAAFELGVPFAVPHSSLSDIATKTINGAVTALDAIRFFLDCASCNPCASVSHRASSKARGCD